MLGYIRQLRYILGESQCIYTQTRLWNKLQIFTAVKRSFSDKKCDIFLFLLKKKNRLWVPPEAYDFTHGVSNPLPPGYQQCKNKKIMYTHVNPNFTRCI